jgi:hypothetical protein
VTTLFTDASRDSPDRRPVARRRCTTVTGSGRSQNSARAKHDALVAGRARAARDGAAAESWAGSNGWASPSRWAVHEGDEVIIQSPPMRAGWFWVLSGPFVGLYAVWSIHDTPSVRISGAVLSCLFWSAIGWPYLRARVTLAPECLRVRRSVTTRFVPWQQFAGFRWRRVLVSRLASKGLQVQLGDGHHLLVRLLAISSRRAKPIEDHIQRELEQFRGRHTV